VTPSAGKEPMTGERLREWMDRYQFSQRVLARQLGVAPSTVTRWRRGPVPQGRILELALDGLLYETGALP